MGTHDTLFSDMEKNISLLISFVGYRDPYPEQGDYPGPLLSFLMQHPVDEVHLLCSNMDYLERAKDVEKEAHEEGITAKFFSYDFALQDVINYEEIWRRLAETLEAIKSNCQDRLPARFQTKWYFLLDSGTPQMKTSLLVAAATGLFPATLYQGIPPQYAGGIYKARRVDLSYFPITKKNTPQDTETNEGKVIKVPAFSTTSSYIKTYERALRAARYDTPVLLLGETGVGKTLLAREIHNHSARKNQAFIEVNCSAIPAGMAESELFGHVQGAFTGANKNRSGKFKAADKGTLFLDEIGDVPLDIQVKLLKALEENTIVPIGSDEPIVINVRIIAATNRDLSKMVQEGVFRQDLYERLKVVVIPIPPLRERPGDIIALAHQFIDEWNSRYDEHRILSEATLQCFTSYSWPGNIRELKNVIQSAACTSIQNTIEPDVLPPEVSGITTEGSNPPNIHQHEEILPAEGINLGARLLQIEWSYVAQALRKTNGNREAAAKLLGMTGHAFRKALRERFAGFIEET